MPIFKIIISWGFSMISHLKRFLYFRHLLRHWISFISTFKSQFFILGRKSLFFFVKERWRPLIPLNSKNSWTRKSSSSSRLEWPCKAFYVVSIHLWIWSSKTPLELTKLEKKNLSEWLWFEEIPQWWWKPKIVFSEFSICMTHFDEILRNTEEFKHELKPFLLLLFAFGGPIAIFTVQ